MTVNHKTQMQNFTLPDGRVVSCTNKFNTAGVAQEFSAGIYDQCVAKLRPGDTIVDVGGHVGLTALLLAGSIPGIRVIACEPAPPSFACLQRNLARHLPGSVAVQAAIGAEPGTAVLTYYPHSEVMTTLCVDDADDRRNMEVALTNFGVVDPSERSMFLRQSKSDAVQYQVRVTTLAQLFADYGIREVGLLKIDVERGELAVLQGLDEQTWPRVRNIVAEVHDIDGRLTAVVDLLERKGYRVAGHQQDVYTGASTHMITAERSQPGPRGAQ